MIANFLEHEVLTMKYRAGDNVVAHVGKLRIQGIVVEDKEQNCISVRSIDADIMIPITYCNFVRPCTLIERLRRTPYEKKNLLRIRLETH